jgi:hypothetical protein
MLWAGGGSTIAFHGSNVFQQGTVSRDGHGIQDRTGVFRKDI